MNGQGRVFENIFVEQLWQPMKQEDIYLKNYTSGSELTTGINKYFLFYNQERPHISLGYKTHHEVH